MPRRKKRTCQRRGDAEDEESVDDVDSTPPKAEPLSPASEEADGLPSSGSLLPEEQFRLCCKNCNKTFPDDESLEAHIRFHQLTLFSSHGGAQKTFLVRITVKDPVEPRKFVCDICKKVCLYKHHLQKHMRVHISERRERFQCDICKKTYHDVWYMKRHKRTHFGVRPFACEVCGKGFGHKFHLNHHMRMHPSCADCRRYFQKGVELELHRASEHVG
uniref:Putative c2h2-type zn-finger protein n=1 Tax=Ixodes ricinus TaxID=34613 RepID=A0A131Y1Q5_IXORI